MQINFKNQFSEDTCHASIRMNEREYLALRNYMHAKEGHHVWFPYGVRLVKRGRGWYKLEPLRSTRALQKMQFALKVIGWFNKEDEAQIAEEIKRLIPTVLDVDLRVATFSNAYSVGEFGYMSDPTPVSPLPVASSSRLQMLAAKFTKPTARSSA